MAIPWSDWHTYSGADSIHHAVLGPNGRLYGLQWYVLPDIERTWWQNHEPPHPELKTDHWRILVPAQMADTNRPFFMTVASAATHAEALHWISQQH